MYRISWLILILAVHQVYGNVDLYLAESEVMKLMGKCEIHVAGSFVYIPLLHLFHARNLCSAVLHPEWGGE